MSVATLDLPRTAVVDILECAQFLQLCGGDARGVIGRQCAAVVGQAGKAESGRHGDGKHVMTHGELSVEGGKSSAPRHARLGSGVNIPLTT